jgi:hypothetical protein
MTAAEEHALVRLVVGLANNPHISGPWAAKDIKVLLEYLKNEKGRMQ